jgi:hypothetical protein
MGGTSVAKYIGRKGEIFYNPDHGALYISDGHTEGGIPIHIHDGDIIYNSDIIPDADITYNIGSQSYRWKTIYVDEVVVGSNSITFQDVLGGGNPEQTLSLANQVFYITQGVGTNTAYNANAGFNAGGIISQNYTIQLANTSQNLVIGSSSVNTSVIVNQNLRVNTQITFSDSTVQTTAYAPVSNTFNPNFCTNTGNTLSVSSQTGSYIKTGKLCYFRVFVQFGNSSYADGSGQYQITLPFPAAATVSIRGGTLHNTNTASIYHIGGVLDLSTNTTVMPLYYSGSTTDLAWKNTTPVGWMTGNTTHFDISGVYETT